MIETFNENRYRIISGHNQSKKSVMYGGSFDIPTLGHLYVIKQAAQMFSHVIVVVADNPFKKPMFSKEDRVKMLEEMLSGNKEMSHINLSVTTLPENTYLVNFAKEKNCYNLVRGIRDNIDFNYELNILRTNQMICKDVSTVYLMPNSDLSVVSSSWVKSLLGMDGWQKIVKQSVHPCVFKVLQEIVLNKKIDEILKDLYKKLYLSAWSCDANIEELAKAHSNYIKELMKEYKDRPYHNYEHILDGLEVLQKYYKETDPVILYAWLMHDIVPNEDEAIKIAINEIDNISISRVNGDELYTTTINKVKTLIEATKHNTCEYNTEDERVFASVDLMTLGGTQSEYNSYYDLVCNEYREKEKKDKKDNFDENMYFDKWVRGRAEFVRKFLARKKIYPSDYPLFSNREQSARENIENEIDLHTAYLDEN